MLQFQYKCSRFGKGQLFDFIFQAAEACGSLEIDNALQSIRDLEKELDSIKKTSEEGELRALPGENVSCCHVLISYMLDYFSESLS